MVEAQKVEESGVEVVVLIMSWEEYWTLAGQHLPLFCLIDSTLDDLARCAIGFLRPIPCQESFLPIHHPIASLFEPGTLHIPVQVS